MKCPPGSYAQIEQIGLLLVPFRDVAFPQDLRLSVPFTKSPWFGSFQRLELNAVDFDGGQVEIDGLCYQGKPGISNKAFLFRFIDDKKNDNRYWVRYTFDADPGFYMVADRYMREDVAQETLDSFEALIKLLQVEAERIEREARQVTDAKVKECLVQMFEGKQLNGEEILKDYTFDWSIYGDEVQILLSLKAPAPEGLTTYPYDNKMFVFAPEEIAAFKPREQLKDEADH